MCLSYSKGFESEQRKQIFADSMTAESFNEYARRELHCEYVVYDMMQLLKGKGKQNGFSYLKRNIHKLTPCTYLKGYKK